MNKFAHESANRGGTLNVFKGDHLDAAGSMVTVEDATSNIIAVINLAPGESISITE